MSEMVFLIVCACCMSFGLGLIAAALYICRDVPWVVQTDRWGTCLVCYRRPCVCKHTAAR